MSYQPIDALDAIYIILISNEELKNIGFNPENILQSKDIPQTFNQTDKYINIFLKPDEKTINPDMLLQVFQINVSVHNDLQNSRLARRANEVIKKALHKKTFYKHKPCEFLGSIGFDTASLNSITQISSQYGIYITKL